jgi:hypothetical protein
LADAPGFTRWGELIFDRSDSVLVEILPVTLQNAIVSAARTFQIHVRYCYKPLLDQCFGAGATIDELDGAALGGDLPAQPLGRLRIDHEGHRVDRYAIVVAGGTANFFHLIRELPIGIREFPGCSRERAKRQADSAGLARKRTRSPRLLANATQGNAAARRLNERWMKLGLRPSGG